MPSAIRSFLRKTSIINDQHIVERCTRIMAWTIGDFIALLGAFGNQDNSRHTYLHFIEWCKYTELQPLSITINNHMYWAHDAVSERGPSITKGLIHPLEFWLILPMGFRTCAWKCHTKEAQRKTTTRWATEREHRSAVGMGRSTPPKNESNTFKKPHSCKSSGDYK